jgi:hypothetical protein
MRKSLIVLALALIAALVATECNRYSRCREWRVELALRDQGLAPDRSWGAAAADFVAGDLIAVGKKWQCGIAIERGEAVWAAVEAVTLAPVVGSAAVWTFRTVGRGLEAMSAVAREAIGIRVFVRGPMALVGRITTERIPFLVLGGVLAAVYFAQGQLLLDALALLPWLLQLAVWAVLFFMIGRGALALAKAIRAALPVALALRRSARKAWSRLRVMLPSERFS